MSTKERFLLLPRSVRIVFFIFLIVPCISAQLGPSPERIYLQDGFGVAALVTATYWILPLFLCISLLVKHHWFFPLYFFQCGLLAVHSYFFRHEESLAGLVTRILLIATMAGLSLLFANRDFIYPFLSRRPRAWRRARRVHSSYPLHVMAGEGRIRANLVDCSLTGMGISLHGEEGLNFLNQCKEGEMISLEAHLSSGRYIIPTHLIWFDARPGEARLGVRFREDQSMSAFVSSITGNQLAPWTPWQERFAYYWLRGGVQHFALLVWVLSITGAFFMPVSGF